jgi:hypothetical protein
MYEMIAIQGNPQSKAMIQTFSFGVQAVDTGI